MPAFNVNKSIEIDASAAQVRQALVDFREWPKWSPWLCAEPDARMEYRGTAGKVGHGYSWEGKAVGAGGMDLIALESNRLAMDLNFLRPFKSSAKVVFAIDALTDSTTKVSWLMDSKLPFFLFFWVGTFKNMIGNDYQRGLRLLKEYVETGDTQCQIEVLGVESVEAIQYAGLTSNSSLEDMSESMQVTLPKVSQLAADKSLTIMGPPISVYHKVNMKTLQCNYTAAIPVATSTTLDDGALELGQLESGNVLKVRFRGDYQHLGNAWSAAMMHRQAMKLKVVKNRPPYEIYVGDPAVVHGKDLITELYIPVR